MFQSRFPLTADMIHNLNILVIMRTTTPESIMAERIVFIAKQEVNLKPFTPPSVGPDNIAVRSLYSLMSTGTENIVFNGLYEPGSH